MKIKHISVVFLLFFFTSCTFLDSCNNNKKTQKKQVEKIIKDIATPDPFNADTSLVFDSTKLNRFIHTYPNFSYLKSDLTQFYTSRNYSFAWFDSSGMLEQASNLITHLVYTDSESIDIVVPYKNEFISLLNYGLNDTLTNVKDSITIYKELMLSAQYFNYARKVWEGADDSARIRSGWFIPRKKLQYDVLLDSITKSSINIFNNEPLYPQYNLLKDYVKRYKQLEKEGGFDSIIYLGKKYSYGDTSFCIKQIRYRLFKENDIESNNESTLFDSIVLKGVLRYQIRNGLKADGIIGKAMIQMLNRPISDILRKLIVNMERCRWLPNDIPSDYLLVNIPDFTLNVYESDSLSWNMNVVVGKVLTKTVIFHGHLQYIVFSPRWTIPSSIVAAEVLPAVKRNISYLSKHNYEVVDLNGVVINPYSVKWSKYTASSLPYKIVQKSGDDNALGRVKFLFPNTYNIYMHDTPAKKYFSEQNRTYSHGCVRLAEPKKLAQYLLRNDSAWTETIIDSCMNLTEECKYTLPKTIPVYIVYFTAWVNSEGILQLRNDIYGRDARLEESLIK